jgi:hypothetical protein
MRGSLEPTSPPHRDTYSAATVTDMLRLLHRGTHRWSLDAFVADLRRVAPSAALCGDAWCSDPRISAGQRPASVIDQSFRLLHADGTPQRSRRGRPDRLAPDLLSVAAQVAHQLDVQGDPADEVLLHLSRALAYHAGRGSRGASPVDPALRDDHSSIRTPYARSKTLQRWRDDGRVVLAGIGAWPWAAASTGRDLAKHWWRRPRYTEPLQSWADAYAITVPPRWQRWAASDQAR